MKYNFPHINHINDVLPHIEGRKEFVVAERDGFTVINYVVMTPDLFPPVVTEADAILRECRGITFCNETGKVVARKFHKFFNVGERMETEFRKLDLSQPHVILEKLDGSMITPYLRDGKVEWHTKMGKTDVADMVIPFVEANPQYAELADFILRNNNATPIFEFCSRKNRVVIDHPEDRMVLLAVRDNVTGKYWEYELGLEIPAVEFNVELVGQHKATFDKDFLEYVRGLVGTEGFVVRFDDGHMLKIKAEDYLQLHRAKEGISHEKNVWSMVLNESVDDLKSFLDDDDRMRVEDFEVKLWREVDYAVQHLEMFFGFAMDDLNKRDLSMFEDADRERKKMFAMEYANNYRKEFKGVLFSMFDGGDVRDLVIQFIKSNVSTGTKLDGIRPLFNNIQFDEREYE